MRLSCPNCDAVYEVPDNVIPPTGRDVQCSNCGSTWFQTHPTQITNDPAPHKTASASAGIEEVSPDKSEQGETSSRFSDQETTSSEDTAELEETEAAPIAPKRRELDPEIAELLRQEVEHETRARAEEAQQVFENQPDLGLTEPDDADRKDARDAHLHMPQPGEQSEGISQEDDAPSGSRRDILPNIEEINSTLRSTNDRSADTKSPQTPGMPHRKRDDFKLGFSIMLIIAACIVLIYANANIITEAAPQTMPFVNALVQTMNDIRIWLDEHMMQIMLWLDEKAASAISGDGT